MKIIPIAMICLMLAFAFVLNGCKKDDPEPPANPGGGSATNPYGAGNGAVTFSLTESVPYNTSLTLGGIGIGQLTQYFYNAPDGSSVVPDCGQASSQALVTVTRPAGTYTWCSTVGNGTTYGGSIAITEGQCTSVGIASIHQGACGSGPSGQGIVTFYQQTNSNHGPITITVDGQNVGSITTVHPSGPTCGSGQVNVPRSQGLHSWTAVAQDGYHYEGSITWPTNGGCTIQQVETLLSPPEPSGPGTKTFWCQTDLGWGPISIYVDGQYRGQVTQSHSGGVTCGQGNVNVQLPAGAYSWHAEAGNHHWPIDWPGTYTVSVGACSMIQLTN